MTVSRVVPYPAEGWRSRIGDLAARTQLDRGLVMIFVASRLLVLLAAFTAETLIPRNPALDPGVDAPILRSLTSWDGWYYLGIVRDGYQAGPVSGEYENVAFPPLYPAVVRALSAPFPGSEGIVAILVANVAFIAALSLLVQLGTPYLGRRRARLAAALLIIYPFASVFTMAYTESLFLLLMLTAFFSAERGQPMRTGVALGLAVLCRVQGIALLLPLAIILLRRNGWRPTPSTAWLLLGPLSAAAYFLFVASVTGSSTGYLDAQQAWGREGLGGASADGTIAAMFTPYQAALLLTLLASVFLLVFVRADRMRPEYWLVPALFIAAELSSGSLEAVGRITMLAFPFVWIIANRGAAVRRMWPIVSAGLFTLISVLQFGGYWVP
ncbi:MAG TPA: glycosyltransferase family 39 protein [Candidatus Limnocylindrales bacterium]|nr:glycosyltransferase family 39 protein [Candidatus Limnocylindrales bacterium]